MLEVSHACKLRPFLCEQTSQKILAALPGVVSWIYLVLSLRRDEWGEGTHYTIQDLTAHENIVLALLGFTEIDETLHQAVTSDLRIIEFSVMSWVATSRSAPLLYAGGNHRNCGSVDAIVSLVRLIADRSPVDLANAVLSGRICSPELFFLRASQRMWMLVKPDALPHVCHAEDIPIDVNMLRITLIIDVLVDTLPGLVQPLLESLSPTYFMDALVRASGLSSEFPCHVGRIYFLEHLLDCVVRVVRWAELRSSFFVPMAKGIISGGIVQLMATCITLPDDTCSTASIEPLETLIKLVLNWATSASLTELVSKAVDQHLRPTLSEMNDESVLRDTVLRALRKQFQLDFCWTPSRRLRHCDNIAVRMPFMWPVALSNALAQHRSHTSGIRDAKPQLSGTCSGCRSVAYCSASCQRQDWQFHRHECQQMRSEYLGTHHLMHCLRHVHEVKHAPR